jgi:hypothetical protein
MQSGGFWDTFSDTWVATDALGRTLPGFDECGPPRPGRYVGIFYFTWLGAHGYDRAGQLAENQGVLPKTDEEYRSPYDITRILAGEQEWGPWHAFHWWGEPHFGYYLSNDEWAIRRHSQMLTEAGVDVIICDVTNGLTYTATYLTICRVFQEIRDAGGRTPQIAFLANSGAPQVVQKLYDEFYSQDLYPDLWFRWKGKPLLLAPSEELSDELKAFFTLRRSWAWSGTEWFGDGRDKWPWLDHHPQKWGWHEGPDIAEQMPVCVAQHATTNIGRSFHDGAQPPPDQLRTGEGLCFAEQWERALEVDPEFVFITGWNEWIAMRFQSNGKQRLAGEVVPQGGSIFVDQYNQEYSRDIEPMRGGHQDNYYYQMVGYIRRFKGVRSPPEPSAPKSIKSNGRFKDWEDVGPEYRDDAGDTAHRDHPGWGAAGPYVNQSGRNDIVVSKVARDKDSLYFYARTRQPITAHTDPHWMMLLLNTSGDPEDGWCGYNFIVNRSVVDGHTTTLERSSGGWDWEPVARLRYAVRGNEIELCIPRAALSLDSAKGPLQLDFKWVDNLRDRPDIMDLLTDGDAAPSGRFAYRYKE